MRWPWRKKSEPAWKQELRHTIDVFDFQEYGRDIQAATTVAEVEAAAERYRKRRGLMWGARATDESER